MTVSIFTASSHSMQSTLVQVECCYGRGYGGFGMVGNASEVVKNGLERALAALSAAGQPLPARRVIFSLLPAAEKKDDAALDLSLAVAMSLLEDERPVFTNLSEFLFFAEIGLDGALYPAKNIAGRFVLAVQHGFKGIVCCQEDAAELMGLKELGLGGDGLEILGFKKLLGVIDWSRTGQGPIPLESRFEANIQTAMPNFDDMYLSENLKSVAQIAALGRHNLLLFGFPGTGKSMFAHRVLSLLPKMGRKQQIESLLLNGDQPIGVRKRLIAGIPPYRSPHHQASSQAILGTPDRPGELSRAHQGVLFLDEFPEFRRDVVEALREPLETGVIKIARAKKANSWHCQTMLITACNNCPCGWLGSSSKRCTCAIGRILAYKRKLSGPILDRIDIHVEVVQLNEDQFSMFQLAKYKGQTEVLATKVAAALEFGSTRNSKLGVLYNCQINAEQMVEASGCDERGFRSLLAEAKNVKTTSRSLIRALRVSRSIADLAGNVNVQPIHLNQALSWSSEAAKKARGDHVFGG